MSTRRYRWTGVYSDDLNNIIEAGSGVTLEFLQRTPWAEITVVDGTRDTDLDDFMADLGYVVDPTGPTIVVPAGAHVVGTEQVILADATLGPVSITLPVTSSRLGNDLQVMKVDASANVVTVTRTGGDTIDGSVTQTLDQHGDSLWLVSDPANSIWEISQSRRAEDITFDDTGIPGLSADNVQDAITDVVINDLTSIEVFTSGEALTAGDVLTFNSSGEVIRANSSIAGGVWEVIGISAETVGASVSVQVFTKSGSLPSVRFGAAPAASLNGRLVFLDSTSGQATVTPPTSNGNTLFTVGTLQGADGASMSPEVLFRPQFIAFRA